MAKGSQPADMLAYPSPGPDVFGPRGTLVEASVRCWSDKRS